MPFIPLESPRQRTDPSFPRVSPDVQADRDAEAARLVADEFENSDDPEQRAILAREYRLRFGTAEPRGFIPLAETAPDAGVPSTRRGFIPLAPQESPEPERHSILRNVLLNNPLTAAAETGLSLATQGVALPVAGLFGLYEAGGKALGLHDRDPAGVVEHMAHELTYQPRGQLGEATTSAVMVPFEKLAEAGQAAGGKVLDATGSPAAATAVDTAINALPMIAPGAVKAVRKGRGFVPIDEVTNEQGAGRLANDAEILHGSAEQELASLRGARDNGLPAVAEQLSGFPGGRGAGADAESLAGPAGRAGELRAGQRGVDTSGRSEPAQTDLYSGNVEGQVDDLVTSGGGSRGRLSNVPLEDVEQAPDFGRGRGHEAYSAAESAAGDLAGRNADASGTRPARWDSASAAEATDPGRMAAREGIEAQPASVIQGASLESRLFSPGGDLGPWEYRKSTRADTLQREVIEDARRHYNEIRQEHGLPPVDNWHIRPDDSFRDRVAAVDPMEPVRPTKAAPAIEPQPEGPPDFDRLTQPQAMRDRLNQVENSWAPGANYAPLIDDTHAPLTNDAPRAKPITREEVLTPFMKALGVPIYEGRIKGNKLGHYRLGLEEVRIKRKSDLEVAAHELAHLLDDRIPEIRKSWSEGKNWEDIRSELKGVSYDQKNVKEGFAEFVRLYLTQPEEAAARAPIFTNWFDNFTSRHKYGPAILQAREGMTSWFEQSAIDRARSKIGLRKPINEALDGIWDKLRQSVADDLHGVYRMERDLHAGKIDAGGAYETARLTRASHSIADGAIRYGYPVRKANGAFEYRGKGLEEILKPVSAKLDDALMYFVGRSAQELMMQGREHLFTKGEIKAMVDLETPETRKAFAEYQVWNRGVLDFAEAHGVINPAARALWQRQSYLPFWRVEQPGYFKGGKPGDWSGIKALTGGTDNLRDILSNITGNASMLIDKAVKNEARQKIANLAGGKGGGRFMIKIPPESRPVKIDAQQVADAVIKAMGIDLANPNKAAQKTIAKIREQVGTGAFDFMMPNQPPGGRNVVAVLRSGKPVWYEVADPILFRALTSIDRPPQPWIVKWLGLPKRIGQMTVTLTPDFMIRNIARDTVMGSVMSREGFRPIVDSLEGMRLRLKTDPLYKEYIANGGGLSSIYLDESALKSKLERFYSRQGIDYKTVLDSPSKLLHGIESIADAFEMSTRLGEYKRAIERGERPRHAAYLGRDISTDFAMKGDSQALGFMYDTCMFLRPAVLSIDRLARGLAHDPNRGTIATKAGMIALFSMGLYLLNKDDLRYTDLPDWDRDSYWHFFVGDNHFRMPKTWEIGALGSIAERTLERVASQDPKGLGKDLSRILSATFGLNLTPQIIAPLKEQMTNRNGFTGSPIETPGMDNVQPFLRAKPTTSETMKAVGMATRNLPEELQVNPVSTTILN